MKLQKQFAGEYKDKMNYKYVIVIPDEAIEKLGWEVGKELKGEVEKNVFIVRPLSGREKEMIEKKKLKMSYEEFKNKIEMLLKENPKGLSWTEIKEKGNFSQKVPNNKWVSMLKNDIGLTRKQIDTKIIWSLPEG